MSEPYLDQVKKPGQTVNPLFAFLGVEIERADAEKAVLRLPAKAQFIQGGGVVAGGILATLADEAMAHAVLARLEPGQMTATIEMNVRYLKAVRQGDIVCEAVVIRAGRSVVTVQAELKDSQGRLLAVAGASFHLFSAAC